MRALRPLSVALAVTAIAAALSYGLPWFSATGVGFCFCLATYLTVLRKDTNVIRHHGLAFGGLFDPVPVDAHRLRRSALRALYWSGVACLVFFPAFWAVSVLWWAPRQGLDWSAPTDLGPTLDRVPGQLLAIAIPEEMFYRGYVQSALDDAFRLRFRVLGATLGAGLLLSSVVFALGHLATDPHVSRLAVFFPSLVFGWLRAKTGGIGAAVAFHVACNVLSFYIGQGYVVR